MARYRTWAEWQALTGDEALSAAEMQLANACKAGEACWLGDGERPDEPDPTRQIRAEFLRYLILGGSPDWPVDEAGVQLSGARIAGDLNLNFASARGATAMHNCWFEGAVTAQQARFELLNLSGARVPGLNAQSVEVTSNVFLADRFHATGEVSFLGAKIGGQLSCDGGRFENADGYALNAQGVEVTGGVFLQAAFHATGEVSLSGAKIGGQLSCVGGRFENADGDALNAQGVEVTGGVFLRDAFHATGEVSLSGAKIGGQLSCDGGRFENAEGDALDAQGVEVAGDVFLRDAFHATGEVSLSGAKIGGQLSCDGGRFENADGYALDAQGVEVTGGVFLRDAFHATGEVSLSGAKIGGQLSCVGGRFENADGDALDAQGVEVTGGVFLRDGFHATGEASFSGSKIRGQLNCSGGRFENADGHALFAQGAEVTGGVILGDGFHATGEVSLSGAKIGGQLICSGGRFENADGHALSAQGVEVKGDLVWCSVTFGQGSLNFASAAIGDLVDDEVSWPQAGQLILHGFTYERFGPSFTDARRRLKWIARGSTWKGEFFPQPYTQLAKVLSATGHDRAARQVRMELERLVRCRARDSAKVTPNGDVSVGLKSIWVDGANLLRGMRDFSLHWLVGYGHAPARSAIALVFLFVVTLVLSNWAWQEGSFAPNSDVILTSDNWITVAEDAAVSNPAILWSGAGEAGQDWETFNAFAYAFDVVVPILSLGQTEAWAPSTNRGPVGRVLWWARWILSSLGWVVTALAAAAITGLIRRDP